LNEGDSGFNEIQKIFTLNRSIGWEGRVRLALCVYTVIFLFYN